jgi:hypothetical protein
MRDSWPIFEKYQNTAARLANNLLNNFVVSTSRPQKLKTIIHLTINIIIIIQAHNYGKGRQLVIPIAIFKCTSVNLQFTKLEQHICME